MPRPWETHLCAALVLASIAFAVGELWRAEAGAAIGAAGGLRGASAAFPQSRPGEIGTAACGPIRTGNPAPIGGIRSTAPRPGPVCCARKKSIMAADALGPEGSVYDPGRHCPPDQACVPSAISQCSSRGTCSGVVVNGAFHGAAGQRQALLLRLQLDVRDGCARNRLGDELAAVVGMHGAVRIAVEHDRRDDRERCRAGTWLARGPAHRDMGGGDVRRGARGHARVHPHGCEHVRIELRHEGRHGAAGGQPGHVHPRRIAFASLHHVRRERGDHRGLAAPAGAGAMGRTSSSTACCSTAPVARGRRRCIRAGPPARFIAVPAAKSAASCVHPCSMTITGSSLSSLLGGT
jgi:hypothetical protein